MAPGTVTRLIAEPLTEEAFRPFGQLIGEGSAAPDFRGEKGTVGWSMDWRGGRAKISYLLTPYRGLDFTKLERHLALTQAFTVQRSRESGTPVSRPTPERAAGAPCEAGGAPPDRNGPPRRGLACEGSAAGAGEATATQANATWSEARKDQEQSATAGTSPEGRPVDHQNGGTLDTRRPPNRPVAAT